ncbi:MAG: PIN domain-containing protein [Planctomycetes bacterium]|nr:PIN domain-containing protein [Planctomycetota bacterium]
MSKRTNYAWDTSVLIAWLSDEATAPLGDIGLVVDEIDREKEPANLIISVTTFSEILESKHTSEQIEKLGRFLLRSNVISVDTTFPIAQKASQIRNAGLKEGRKIKTPDAMIIATAVLLRADVLLSLDDVMLKLSESPIVDGLRITLPRPLSTQRGLGFPNPPAVGSSSP